MEDHEEDRVGGEVVDQRNLPTSRGRFNSKGQRSLCQRLPEGVSYAEAAKAASRRSGDAISHLVSRFNLEGLSAVEPSHVGDRRPTYTVSERERILAEVRRKPDREKDGNTTLVAFHSAEGFAWGSGRLPAVSTYTIGRFSRRLALTGRERAVGLRPARSNTGANAVRRFERASKMAKRKPRGHNIFIGPGGKNP